MLLRSTPGAVRRRTWPVNVAGRPRCCQRVCPHGHTIENNVWEQDHVEEVTYAAMSPRLGMVHSTVGPVYTPAIFIGMSEALNPATANGTTVTLARSGAAVASSVAFAGSNRIVLRPRAVLTAGVYTVTIATGVEDLAGKGLAATYTWRFSVGDGEAGSKIYLPAVQK